MWPRTFSRWILKTLKNGDDTGCSIVGCCLANLLHCLTFLVGKFFSLTSSWSLPCFSLWILSLVLSPWTSVKSLVPSSHWPPTRYWAAASRSPWSHHFSRLNKPWCLRVSSQGRCSSPNHLGDLPQNLLQFVNGCCQNCYKSELKNVYTSGRYIFQVIFMLRRGLKVWKGFSWLMQDTVDSFDSIAVQMAAKPNLISLFCFRYTRPYIARVLLQ